MARGWQYTKLSLLVSALLRVVRACVCAMHPFLFFMGSLRVSASYLSFLAFAFLFCFFPFPILKSFLPCFHFFVFMLWLELCGCSSDIFLSNRPHWIGNLILLDMIETRSVNVKNTHTL